MLFKKSVTRFVYLILITIAAFFTAAAFRSVLQKDKTITVAELITEKKKFILYLQMKIKGKNIKSITDFFAKPMCSYNVHHLH